MRTRQLDSETERPQTYWYLLSTVVDHNEKFNFIATMTIECTRGIAPEQHSYYRSNIAAVATVGNTVSNLTGRGLEL